MTNKTFKPGQTAPASAQYKVGSTSKEITVPKGHTFPPSQKAGTTYSIADRTNNKSGRG